MKRVFILCAVVTLIAVLSGCGQKVMVPPRIDLKEHEVVGIIEFDSPSEGELEEYATRKFTEAIRRDQGMVRIVQLGSETVVLEGVGRDRLDQITFKALGERHDVNTIITGELVVSDIRPDLTITPGFGFASLAAEVDATLSVQMVETNSGASIWSTSASATERVGEVSLFGGEHFSFDAEDPDDAYGKLVDALVKKTTEDFRVTWKRK